MGHFLTHSMESIHARDLTSVSDCSQRTHRGQGSQEELGTRQAGEEIWEE